MSTKFPEIEKMRNRAKAKVTQLRGRVGGLRGQKGYRSQPKIGGGELVKRAQAKADEFMRKVKERKPGFIPMVKEFKPGSRIRKVVPTGKMRGDLTSLPVPTRSGKGFSIADEPAKPYEKEIVIEA